MDRGKATRYSVAGISLLVLASALILASGIGLSTAPSAYAQSNSSSSDGDPSWTVSSEADWWNNSSPAENDVRTTIDNTGNLGLTGENLVGYWSFDNFPSGFGSTDNTVYDLTSYVNDGTAQNGPTIVGGDNAVFDNALDFDETSEQYIDLANVDNNFDTTKGGLAFVAWVNRDELGEWDSFYLLNDVNTMWQLQLTNNDVVRGQVFSSATNDKVYSDTVPSTGTWYFLVFQHNTSDDDLELWVDGQMEAENDQDAPLDNPDHTRHQLAANVGGGNYFDGQIDEPMIFDHYLTEDQIKRLYNRTKPSELVGDNLKSGTWISEVWDCTENTFARTDSTDDWEAGGSENDLLSGDGGTINQPKDEFCAHENTYNKGFLTDDGEGVLYLHDNLGLKEAYLMEDENLSNISYDPRSHGMAWNSDNGTTLNAIVTSGADNVWEYNQSGGKIYNVELADVTIIKDVAYDPDNDWIWATDAADTSIVVAKYSDGSTINQYNAPASNPKGIAYVENSGGDYLWLFCEGSNNIYKYRASDFTEIENFSNPVFGSGTTEGIDVRREGGTDYLYIAGDDDGDPAETGGDKNGWLAKVNASTGNQVGSDIELPGWDAEGTALKPGENIIWYHDEYQPFLYEMVWNETSRGTWISENYEFSGNLENIQVTATKPSGSTLDMEAITSENSKTFTVSDGTDNYDVSDLAETGEIKIKFTLEENSTGASPEVDNFKIYEGRKKQTVDNLEFSASIGTGENVYAKIGSDTDDDGSIENWSNSDSWTLLDGKGGTWDDPDVEDGYAFQVKYKLETDNTENSPSVQDYTLTVSRANLVPNILDISVDNALIDRDQDYSGSGAVTATKVTVRVRDNDNRSDIVPLRFSLRDNNDSTLVDNVEVTENSVVDENTLDFTYTFNPSDTLADDNLGKFDVRSEARDNAGACHVENFLELGHAEFTVSDRVVENITFENDYEHVLKVTADSARVVGPAASTTSSTLTDNNLGDYDMGSDLAVSYETTQDGKVTVKATDENVDGISSSKSYAFPNFHPSIESISVDNALIDRDNDTGVFSSTENTTISVTWSDPDNRTNDLTSEADALLSVRDNTDVAVLSEENIIDSKTSVDENTVKTSYTFNPSDSLDGENMGAFDVKFRGVERYGMENVSDYTELGESLFTVNDLTTSISVPKFPEDGEKITVSGKAKRLSGDISLDNVILVVGDRRIQADFDNDGSWSATYRVTADVGETVEATVHLLDKGSRLDGTESTTYQVQESGQSAPSFNPTEQNLNINLQIGLYQGREPSKGGRIGFQPSSEFKPGDRVTVVAYLSVNGIEISHADITGSWNGSSFPMGDKKGNRFVGTFTIPKGTKPGSYLVSVDASARGLQSTASKTITVRRAKKGINLVKLIKDYWFIIVIIIILLLIVLE